MKRIILSSQVWWFNADGLPFWDAVKEACAFHLRREGVPATHCSVHPDEPGIVAKVGDVVIVSNVQAGVGNFCSHLASA